MDRKKTLIIILIIAIILLLGGAYLYFSKKSTTVPPAESFPGASSGTTGGTTGETVGESELDLFTPGKPLPRLYELHKSPVAGVGFFESDTYGNHNVSARYIEKGLGYIFETPLSTYNESRIVNETRPTLSEALWGNNGKSVVVRFIDPANADKIKSRIISIGASTTAFPQDTGSMGTTNSFLKTSEVFLPDFIPFVAVSEDQTDQFFYLENGMEAVKGSISTFGGSSVSKVFSASFTEWLPQFPNQNLVTLTTKPSSGVPGYLYFIDLRTKILTKILGEVAGLTTLTSHDGKEVLISETKRGVPVLSLYDTERKASYNLSLNTLPEKCAWGVKNPTIAYCAVPQAISMGKYPDQWYQGMTSFSDTLWEINTATLGTEKVMDPRDFGALALDIINPTLSQDDEYVLFMNKKTGTPWVYQTSSSQRVAVTPSAPTATEQPTVVTPTPSLQDIVTPDMQKIK